MKVTSASASSIAGLAPEVKVLFHTDLGTNTDRTQGVHWSCPGALANVPLTLALFRRGHRTAGWTTRVFGHFGTWLERGKTRGEPMMVLSTCAPNHPPGTILFSGFSRIRYDLRGIRMKQSTAELAAIPYLDLPAQMRGIRKEIDAAIAQTLDRCSFCLGPDVAQFEKEFAAFSGVEHCVGFNNGTSALHIAMLLLELGPGDEVITVPFTFVATSWAISYVGARPVYVDIDDATFNIDVRAIERAVTPRTRAIVPVHLYGQPCDLAPLVEICRKHKLALVEDAAQAHGAKYHGKGVGTFGAVSTFSFYPGKNLGAYGEGGALVTAEPGYAARARALRDHGSTERYYHDEIGYNYRMEGIQAAVLRVKLKYLDKWIRERRQVARRYQQLLAETPLQLPVEPEGVQSAWHLFVVRHPRRDELKRHLETHQIGCGMHYPVPLHLQKAYAHLGYKAGDFPVAEKAARECLSLPIYPELTDSQIERVASVVKDFFAR